MYLIDTNIIIWVLRGNTIYERILQELKNKDAFSISTITIAEIYKNVFPAEFEDTNKILGQFEALDVTVPIAKIAGFYWKQYIKKLRKLHILDCLIAATAKEHRLTLLTLNTRHFPMDDIKVMDPLSKKRSKN